MRFTVFWKLSLTYLVLLLLVLLSIYVYTARLLREDSLQGGYEQLESLARLAGGRPPPLDDQAALESWTTWLAGSGARITVIATDGRVLIDSEEEASRMENHADRPEIRQSMAEGTGQAARYSSTLRRDLVYLAVRREMEDGEAVILRFALPLARINDAISAVRDRVATAMLVVMFVGAVLTVVFTRSFASRVQRLQEFSRRVAEGDFHPMPVRRRGDELVELARSLNIRRHTWIPPSAS